MIIYPTNNASRSYNNRTLSIAITFLNYIANKLFYVIDTLTSRLFAKIYNSTSCVLTFVIYIRPARRYLYLPLQNFFSYYLSRYYPSYRFQYRMSRPYGIATMTVPSFQRYQICFHLQHPAPDEIRAHQNRSCNLTGWQSVTLSQHARRPVLPITSTYTIDL